MNYEKSFADDQKVFPVNFDDLNFAAKQITDKINELG